MTIGRRTFLSASASAPFALTAAAAVAQATPKGPGGADFRRVRLGAMEVTTLLEGARAVEGPQGIFGTNVEAERFANVSAENFLPADKMVLPFTPSLVLSGEALVLFDTGNSPETITAALASADVRPEDITHVVLTHMHPDHIGGLSEGGVPTFANAEIIAGQVEFDAFAGAGNAVFDAKVRPLQERITTVTDGASPISGLSAHDAFGHTPGHMVWRAESEGRALIIAADTANHPVYSLAHPDWEVLFDADKSAAAATRRRIFGQIADERIPFIGFHMPFPGMGFVERHGDGFRYVALSYQLDV